MRPIHLTIEGLRSFRSPVSLDFTGRDQVAIVGDTGAGKSSILEAITYALYGQTTFTAHANQELMNDTSMHLRVVLRFRVSGETWEVARTLRRSGQGDVGQVRALLRRIGDDDANIEQVEQVRRVNQRIVELLGLDSDAFLRTVVLPQGRFARLLVEDEPRDRSRILRQVWRTDELEAAGELVGKARQESEMLRVRLEQTALEYPDDPAAHLEQLTEAFDKAHRRDIAASEDEKAASAARETVLASEDAQEAAGGVIETLRALSLEQAVNRLVPIAKLVRQLDNEDATLKEQQAQLEDALSRIPTDDGPTREEVAATLTTLQGLGALASSSEEAAAALRVSVASASKKHSEARLLAEKAATAQNRAAEHAAKRSPLDQAARAALERRNRVEQGHTRCAERSAACDEYRKRLETLRAEEAECAQRLQNALQTQVAAALEMTAADEHLAASRRSESAAAAAHDLHPGDACPICRRDLPAEWKALDATGLIEAEQVAKAARHAAKAADIAITRFQTGGTALHRQITHAEAELVASVATFQGAREELAQDVDLSASAPLPERDVLVAPLEAVCTERSKLLAEHDHVAEALREAATRQDKEAGIAQRTAAGADELAIQSRRNVTQALRQLETAIRTIPQAFRPRLDLPTNTADLRKVDMRPVGEQTKSAQERKQVLEARRSERDRKRGEIDVVRNARAALARRRADEVEGPIKELVRELHAHRDILVESVSRLGLDAVVPPALSAQEVDELESHIGELRNKSAAVSSAADERLREAAGRGGSRSCRASGDWRTVGRGDRHPRCRRGRPQHTHEGRRCPLRCAPRQSGEGTVFCDHRRRPAPPLPPPRRAGQGTRAERPGRRLEAGRLSQMADAAALKTPPSSRVTHA